MMRVLMSAVLAIQISTFAVLGIYFLSRGNWRLGIAQLLLCAVQALIFSGRLT